MRCSEEVECPESCIREGGSSVYGSPNAPMQVIHHREREKLLSNKNRGRCEQQRRGQRLTLNGAKGRTYPRYKGRTRKNLSVLERFPLSSCQTSLSASMDPDGIPPVRYAIAVPVPRRRPTLLEITLAGTYQPAVPGLPDLGARDPWLCDTPALRGTRHPRASTCRARILASGSLIRSVRANELPRRSEQR